MANHGKKYINALKKVNRGQIVPLDKALDTVKSLAYAKFDESVDVDVNLGIDASKGEQVVRGSVVLPYSRGKAIRVLVFAKDEYAQQAEKAGADYVGVDDLIEKIKGGWLEFDYAVATPDLMGIIGSLAKILGPRGLLPNKKLGTVTFDVKYTVEDLKKGRVFFKNDKSGIVHFPVGKVSFGVDQLKQNLAAFVKALALAKPPTAKGKYLRKMTISSTMGIGVSISPDEVLLAS